MQKIGVEYGDPRFVEIDGRDMTAVHEVFGRDPGLLGDEPPHLEGLERTGQTETPRIRFAAEVLVELDGTVIGDLQEDPFQGVGLYLLALFRGGRPHHHPISAA
ncbi:hypothetical protein ACFFRH_03660 [Streptosporangium vulgare]|uniref:Uncharacterized protein n=1 Tax=Streptosporangium vulgare TaxID=46190 RepID=A0ABV5T669_9ACTN